MASRQWWAGMAGAAVLLLAAAPVMADAPAGGGGGGSGTAVFLQIPDWMFNTFDYIVLSMLGVASITGIALAIDAILHIREKRIAPVETTEHLRQLITNREYKTLMDFAATDSSFVSKALYAGIRRAHLKYAAMREALDSSISEQTSALFRRIEPMNVIGNIGPLLGLLGTVLGMILAFKTMRVTQGQADAAQLSGGIGIALAHTFLGLFVAIPCLVVYGFYRTRVDRITTKAAIAAEELLEDLRPESPTDESPLKKKPRAGGRDSSSTATGVPSPMPVPQPQALKESE